MVNDTTYTSETPEIKRKRATGVPNRSDWFGIVLTVVIVGLLIWWRLA